MSDSYDDYELGIQLAEQAWEKRVVKIEHDKQIEIAQAYERGWNAALAQQEPVAWMTHTDDLQPLFHKTRASALNWQTQPTPLYAAPPKREWVGLTDQEINSVRHKRDWTAPWTDLVFARAIEAKLREKNHG